MVLVENLVFKIGQGLIRQYAELSAEFHSPFPVRGEQAFFQICVDKWMDVHDEVLNFQVVDQIVELFLQCVGEQQRWLDLSFSEAGRACLGCHYVESRTYALTGDLHKTKLAKREYVVACAVALHYLFHVLVELLAMFGLGHIDEVDHYDAAHVAKTELTGNLVGSAEVDLKCVALLIVGGLGAVAGVDIDHVECFRVFDDDVGSAAERHCLAKRRFDLFGDIEMIENRFVFFVELNDFLALRGYESHIFRDLFVGLFVVDLYAFEFGIEDVAQHTDYAAFFLEYKCRGC